MTNIGKRIAIAREAKGLNQSELARALGVRPQSVQAWEASRNIPRPKKLEAIAVALGTSIGHLMGEPDRANRAWASPVISDGKIVSGQAASNHRIDAAAVLPILDEIVMNAIQRGALQKDDIILLTTVVSALIEKNERGNKNAPNLPEELEALADSAFANAEAGGDSEDMVKMIGHGLKKSGAKESSPRNAKRKTGSD